MGSSTPNWVMLLARSSSPDLENFRRGFILLGWIFLRSTSGTPSSFCGRHPPRHGEPAATAPRAGPSATRCPRAAGPARTRRHYILCACSASHTTYCGWSVTQMARQPVTLGGGNSRRRPLAARRTSGLPWAQHPLRLAGCGRSTPMEFYLFHLMPWPYLPDDFDERYSSAWVTCPNSLYDPVQGQALYNRYLDELELGEQLGFDGVCVNEHHQTSYGLMPAPNIIAATLARRTSRIKIALMGNAVPLRDHPLRIAEEVAMLDVITGGRIISGFVRGIGCEYYSFGVNPAH